MLVCPVMSFVPAKYKYMNPSSTIISLFYDIQMPCHCNGRPNIRTIKNTDQMLSLWQVQRHNIQNKEIQLSFKRWFEES